MEQVTVVLDEKQVAMLQALCKHRKDDNTDDFLDETFIQNIFKIGLMDAMRFYSAQDRDPELADMAADYMGTEMLGSDMSAEDLEKLWGPNGEKE